MLSAPVGVQAEVTVAPKVGLHNLRRVLLHHGVATTAVGGSLLTHPKRQGAYAQCSLHEFPAGSRPWISCLAVLSAGIGAPRGWWHCNIGTRDSSRGGTVDNQSRTVSSTRKWRVRTAMQVARKPRQKMDVE